MMPAISDTDRRKVEEVVGLFSYSRGSRLYVLSSRERRVTVYSQQLRALNLIHALVMLEKLKAGNRIGVVGGGVAGLTAAVAALMVGAEVHLFEQQPGLLPFQSGNSTRWLHPRIYDWPLPVAEMLSTDLPFLNWSMGTAGDVADQLLLQFNQITRAAQARFELIPSCGRINCDVSSSKVRLTRNGDPSDYDFVIAAVGFGTERTIPPVPRLSYWRNDEHAQPLLGRKHNSVLRYLITGAGDGGLIDLLRVRLEGFRQDRIVAELFEENDTLEEKRHIQELLERLRTIHSVLRSPETPEHDYLVTQYQKLRSEPGFHLVKRRLRLRRDTSAVLHGINSIWASPLASMLHSFLAFTLLDRDGFVYRSGAVAIARPEGEDEWTVTFTEGTHVTPPEKFHRVIIRHGAEPDSPQDTLEEKVKEFRERIRRLAELDHVRDYERDLTGQRLGSNTNEWWERLTTLPIPRSPSSREEPVYPNYSPSLRMPEKFPPPPATEEERWIRSEQEAKQYMASRIGKANLLLHVSVSTPFTREKLPPGTLDVFDGAVIDLCKRRGHLRYIANFEDPARLARVRRIQEECPEAFFEARAAPQSQPAINYLLFDPDHPQKAELILIVEGPAQLFQYMLCRNPALVAAFKGHFQAFWDKLGVMRVQQHASQGSAHRDLATALEELSDCQHLTQEQFEQIAKRHGLSVDALATSLEMLSPFGVVNVGDERSPQISTPRAANFIRSMAALLRDGISVVDDWQRLGADSPPSASELLSRGVRFLAEVEERRIKKQPGAKVIRRLEVANAFIKSSSAGRDVFLVAFRSETDVYQLIGGTLKTGEEQDVTLGRELDRAFPKAKLKAGHNYWAQRLTSQPFVERFVSPTYGAYTEYHVTFYALRFHLQIELAPHHRWVTLNELQVGVTNGRKIVTSPASIEKLRSTLELLPASFPSPLD